LKKAKDKIIFVKLAPKWATQKRATTKQAATKWSRQKDVLPAGPKIKDTLE